MLARNHGPADREMKVLEGDPTIPIPPPPQIQGLPPIAADPRVTAFGTLTALCGTYPGGMGYACDVNGVLNVWNPHMMLYSGPPDSTYLKQACLAHCTCPDIAPNDPGTSEGTRPEQCVINNIADAVVDAAAASAVAAHAAACTSINYRELKASDNIVCSEFYDNPYHSDCEVTENEMIENVEIPLDTEECLTADAAPH